jgi:hypothetical protein
MLLLAAGIVFIVVGVSRAQGPYRRAAALREHERNLARYDSWRGGRYVSADEKGPTSAELMERELMGQSRRWGAIAIAGFVLLLAAFMLR